MINILRSLFGKPKKPASLRDLAEAARSLTRPAAQLVISDAPSRSWFGGDPALPAGTDWAENKAAASHLSPASRWPSCIGFLAVVQRRHRA